MLVRLLVLAAAAAALAQDTTSVYDQVVNRFYSVHLEPREWRTAGDICREEGATLPAFPSLTHRILLSYVQYKNYDYSRPFALELWVDVTPTEGPVFLAGNGSVLPAGGSQKLPFACVRGGIDCNTAETGYAPAPSGVSCYKFHEAPSMPISWLWAFTECQAEDAHLVIPDDDMELRSIDAYTKKRRGKYWMAIGVHEFLADGVYRTLDGKVLPIEFQTAVDTKVGGRCVYLDDFSNLRTFPCEGGHASYLCEKDVVPRVDGQQSC